MQSKKFSLLLILPQVTLITMIFSDKIRLPKPKVKYQVNKEQKLKRESFHKFYAGFPTDDDIKNKILGTKIFYFKKSTKMVL